MQLQLPAPARRQFAEQTAEPGGQTLLAQAAAALRAVSQFGEHLLQAW